MNLRPAFVYKVNCRTPVLLYRETLSQKNQNDKLLPVNEQRTQILEREREREREKERRKEKGKGQMADKPITNT